MLLFSVYLGVTSNIRHSDDNGDPPIAITLFNIFLKKQQYIISYNKYYIKYKYIKIAHFIHIFLPSFFI